jgi:hexokinase
MANCLPAPTPPLARKVTGDALQDEFTRLRELFTVDSAKLKQITDHFVHELEVGKYKPHFLTVSRHEC